jgi:hypothetical protein
MWSNDHHSDLLNGMHWLCNKNVTSVMTAVNTFMKADSGSCFCSKATWTSSSFNSSLLIALTWETRNSRSWATTHSGGYIWWPLLRARKHVYSCHQQPFILTLRTLHPKHSHCHRWPSGYQACMLLSILPISILDEWPKRAPLINSAQRSLQCPDLWSTGEASILI